MSEKKAIIEVSQVWKVFKLPHEKVNTAKQLLVNIFKKKSFSNQEVLKGISFKVYEGEFFGIVGRNGCGKSTLLKMLAGIYVPNRGKITLHGRVSPFLELGVGFNPELTGIENIYLNGAILGLAKEEIDKKLSEIISFSELEEFMDLKLKNYSSGMQVRLAFSVAIHAHAPIILLDEILAVGDANFQQKCNNEFTKLKKSGRTIVFVSHSMDSIIKYCDRAILIDKGEILQEGAPAKVAYEYNKLNIKRLNDGSEVQMSSNEWGDGQALIKKLTLMKSGREIDPVIKFGEDFQIKVDFRKNSDKKLMANFAVALYKDNLKCFDSNTFDKKYKLQISAESNTIIFNVIKPRILPGMYQIYFTLFGDHGVVYHTRINALNFQIVGSVYDSGVVPLNYSWDYNGEVFKKNTID